MSNYEILVICFQGIGIVISASLWIVGFKNLKELKNQNNQLLRQNKAETMQKIIDAHRSIYLTILSDRELTSYTCRGNTDVQGRTSEIIGTLFINHFSTVYLYAKNRLIDNDTWIGMQNDIAQAFKWDLVKNRWNNIKNTHPQEFQDLIEQLTERGRLVNIDDLQ